MRLYYHRKHENDKIELFERDQGVWWYGYPNNKLPEHISWNPSGEIKIGDKIPGDFTLTEDGWFVTDERYMFYMQSDTNKITDIRRSNTWGVLGDGLSTYSIHYSVQNPGFSSYYLVKSVGNYNNNNFKLLPGKDIEISYTVHMVIGQKLKFMGLSTKHNDSSGKQTIGEGLLYRLNAGDEWTLLPDTGVRMDSSDEVIADKEYTIHIKIPVTNSTACRWVSQRKRETNQWQNQKVESDTIQPQWQIEWQGYDRDSISTNRNHARSGNGGNISTSRFWTKLSTEGDLESNFDEAVEIYNSSDIYNGTWVQVEYSTGKTDPNSTVIFKDANDDVVNIEPTGWIVQDDGIAVELRDGKVYQTVETTGGTQLPNRSVSTELVLSTPNGYFYDDVDVNPNRSENRVDLSVYTRTPFHDLSIKVVDYSTNDEIPIPENFIEIAQDATLPSDQIKWGTVGDELQRIGPWHTHDNNEQKIFQVRSTTGESARIWLRPKSNQTLDSRYSPGAEKTFYFDITGTKRLYDINIQEFITKSQTQRYTIYISTGVDRWEPKELPLKPGFGSMEVRDYTYYDWLNDIVNRINRDRNSTYKVHRLKGGTVEIKGDDRSYEYGLFVQALTPGSDGNNIALKTSGHGQLLADTLTAGADITELDNGGAGGYSINGSEYVTFGVSSGSVVGDQIETPVEEDEDG